MARKFPISSVNRISEINLTSMMDMTFLLLITFIITFPLMEQGVPVNLPRGLADDLKPEDAITLSLDARARVYLNDSPITLEQLARRMQDLGRRDPDATVRVRADAGLKYEEVVRILKILHDAKIARMALVTQADDRPQP